MAQAPPESNLVLRTVTIHPNGNIKLLVDGEKELPADGTSEIRTMIVSSSAMRLASPVWSVMFDPRQHWTKMSAGTIAFLGNDPDTLLLLLRMAHADLERVPRRVNFIRLLNIAQLCVKYDLLMLVRRHFCKWLDSALDSMHAPGHEEWLYIMWAFGFREFFKDLAQRAVHESELNNNGDIVTRHGRPWSSLIIAPPGIMGKLGEILRMH